MIKANSSSKSNSINTIINGWKKNELGELIFTITPPIKLNTKDYLENGKYPIVDQGKKTIVGHTNNDAAVFNDLPAIIFGDHTKEVKFIDFPFAVGADGVKILDSNEIEKIFLKFVLENAVKKLPELGYSRYFSELKNIVISFPDKPEQKAIAQVLSTSDAAIHTTEKLIAQKELLKKWLMQQLLTGKKRLKGFDGEWKETAIGEMGIIQTGNTPSKLDPKNWDGKHNWCTADDMKSKYVSNTLQKLSDKGWETARIAKANSVLVTCIASIGVNAIAKVDTGFNQQINSITPSTNYNVEFIYYLILFSKNKLMEYAGAGALPMLNKNTFMSIKFKIPILEEQTAIAQVLQAADKEISLLKAKAEKLREQKKGLMQQLLTGKIRLKL